MLLSGSFFTLTLDLRILFFHSSRSNLVHHLFTLKFYVGVLIESSSDLYINDSCELGQVKPAVSKKDLPYGTPVVTFAD